MISQNAAELLQIASVPDGVRRPRWSVMIPTYNCARYLAETLESVLCQDPGPEQMHVEVIDDCSTVDDPQSVVDRIGRGRVLFHRNLENKGAVRTFNTCIQRSAGELVHILHGDDLVRPGYYEQIANAADKNPRIGLFATRCFFIDENAFETAVSERILELENGGNSPEPFFYQTPIQFAAVTVRRASYEALGGFRSDLVHTADCEMWARIVGAHGGMVLPKVLASYRVFSQSDTNRLAKTAENILDLCYLNEIFSARYSRFSPKVAQQRIARIAWNQYCRFNQAGDNVAAAANRKLWAEHSSLHRRSIEACKDLLRPHIKRIARFCTR